MRSSWASARRVHETRGTVFVHTGADLFGRCKLAAIRGGDAVGNVVQKPFLPFEGMPVFKGIGDDLRGRRLDRVAMASTRAFSSGGILRVIVMDSSCQFGGVLGIEKVQAGQTFIPALAGASVTSVVTNGSRRCPRAHRLCARQGPTACPTVSRAKARRQPDCRALSEHDFRLVSQKRLCIAQYRH
jgi:hypothetical protein